MVRSSNKSALGPPICLNMQLEFLASASRLAEVRATLARARNQRRPRQPKEGA